MDEMPADARTADDSTPPRAPAWVWILLVGLAVVAAAVLLGMVLLGGDHGPGRHGS